MTWILKEQDWMVWTGFIWFRKGRSGGLLLNTVTYDRDAQNARNFISCGTISFPRRTVVHGVKSTGWRLVGFKVFEI